MFENLITATQDKPYSIGGIDESIAKFTQVLLKLNLLVEHATFNHICAFLEAYLKHYHPELVPGANQEAAPSETAAQ